MAEIAGLKLIVPSSVAGSGVSVSASGKVTFTAATAANVNGCFTSTYDNYLLVIKLVSSATGNHLQMRMRASGTDNSTASSYVRQKLDANNTNVFGSRTTGDLWQIIRELDTNVNGLHTYLYGPFLAQPTAFRSVTVAGRSNAWITDHAGTHNQSTAYDGFTLYPTAGTFTGVLTIYGLAQ